MAFNPDPIKQAQEVVFFKKPRESFHPNLYFNKFLAGKVQTWKHLGLKLDKKLTFKEHFEINLPKLIGELEFWKNWADSYHAIY